MRRTRDKWPGPTAYSELCSAHFDAESFEESPTLHHNLGLGKKKMKLQPVAVPTIFRRISPSTHPKAASPAKRRRGAYEKRQRLRVNIYLEICIETPMNQ